MLIVLVGCYYSPIAGEPVSVTQEDVVGVWSNAVEGSIDFREDRTFESNMPDDLHPQLWTGSGVWSIASDRDRNERSEPAMYGSFDVALEYRERDAGNGKNVSCGLSARLVDGEIFLYVVLGDPDTGELYSFVK